MLSRIGSLSLSTAARFDSNECFAFQLDEWKGAFIDANIRSTETSSG